MRCRRSDPVLPWPRGVWLTRPALPLLWLAVGLLGAFGAGGVALATTPVGSEFQVNTYTTGYQLGRSVAADADGDFVVVWTSFGSAGSDTSGSSVQGQCYDSSGNAVGSEFQVNSYTTGTQEYPSVAVDADGNFAVVWESDGSSGNDSSSNSIQGQRYDSSGNPVGSEFQVNTYTTQSQEYPSVSADAGGGFVVVWQSEGSSGSDTDQTSVQSQRYDASGNPVGSEFQANTHTTSDQLGASVAAGADGDFIAVWQSDGSSGSDNDSNSIQAQRYTVQAPQLPSLSPPGVIGLALLLFGIAAAALRGRLRERA